MIQEAKPNSIPQILSRVVGIDGYKRIRETTAIVFPRNRIVRVAANFSGVVSQSALPILSEAVMKEGEEYFLLRQSGLVVCLAVLVEAGVLMGTALAAMYGQLTIAAMGRAAYNLGAGTLNESLRREANKKRPSASSV